MQALFRHPSLPLRATRLLSSHITPPAARYNIIPNIHQSVRLFCDQNSVKSFGDDMGKDKGEKKGGGFNLKVPKGTRDCMLTPELLLAY
jgi:histidyl-tRNA synthetase